MHVDKVIRGLIIHFINEEGTDHLSFIAPSDFPSFSAEEFEYLCTMRDQARKQVGW